MLSRYSISLDLKDLFKDSILLSKLYVSKTEPLELKTRENLKIYQKLIYPLSPTARGHY